MGQMYFQTFEKQYLNKGNLKKFSLERNFNFGIRMKSSLTGNYADIL